MLRRLFTREQLEDGAYIPRFFGRAYRDFITGDTTYYVIPINLMVRFVHNLQHGRLMRWLKWGQSHKIELAAYNAGYKQAEKQAEIRERGMRDQLRRELKEEIRNDVIGTLMTFEKALRR